MDFFRALWDDPDDLDGNVEHIAEHGLTIDDVEEVLENPTARGIAIPVAYPACGATRQTADTSSWFVKRSSKTQSEWSLITTFSNRFN